MQQEVTLRQLAEEGRLERFVVEKAADLIAQFHMEAGVCKPEDRGDGEANARNANFIEARVKGGCYRSIFQNLQLQNLWFVNDVVSFTCKTNDTTVFACRDVLENLASILCELNALGLKAQANILFNRYFDVTGGVIDHPSTLDALQCMMNPSVSDQPHSPKLVAVGGLSGGGKSRMGRMLAPFFETTIGARVVRTDVVRKRMMGVALSERLQSHGYTVDKTTLTYELFYQELASTIEQGHTAIADGVFAMQEQREEVEELALRLGVPFVGFWVNAPIDVRTRRVAARQNNVSDVTEEVLLRQLNYDLGTISWHEIDSSGPKDETLRLGLRRVGL